MFRKLALKRLTDSDLTFFYWYFSRPGNRAKQKAFNLNADVFVDELYPGFPEAALELDNRVPLDLTFLGPGLAGRHNLQRKIVRSAASKNWRLDGEYVQDPPENPARFHALRPDDLAVFEFIGDGLPRAATALLLAAALDEDRELHRVLSQTLGSRKMATIQPFALSNRVQQVEVHPAHPIRLLALDTVMEDAALGGAHAIETLLASPVTPKISAEALRRMKQNAERTGALGEELVNIHLGQRQSRGEIESFQWTAREIVLSPFDFRLVEPGGAPVLLDVKSTKNEFEADLHVSHAELRQMVTAAERYDLYRAYRVEEATAQLRIARDVRDFARTVLDGLHGLPSGVLADSVSFSPTLLQFGEPIDLAMPDNGEEEPGL